MDVLSKPVKHSTASHRPKGRKTSLGRDAWLKAAKAALIREGIGGVEIGKLAAGFTRRAAVSTGFFRAASNCWIISWQTGKRPIPPRCSSTVSDRGSNGTAEFKALVDMWVNEAGYSPQWDAAVRESGPHLAARRNGVRSVCDDVAYPIIQDAFFTTWAAGNPRRSSARAHDLFPSSRLLHTRRARIA